MPFFNFRECIKKHNIPFFDKSVLMFLLGPRNIGKTTDPLNEIMGMVSENCKILIARITEKQLKIAIQDFNNRFRERFKIIGGMIYRLVPQVKIFNKNRYNDDEVIYKQGECVGYVADLNNYHNYKSVEAKDVKFMFLDEVIQMDNIQFFYEKLVNLFMTYARFNKPSILLIGNRDSANNELMVNWDIEPMINAPKEDRVIEVDKNVFFVELGSEQFEDLYKGDEPHIIKTLAKFNNTTNSYINEGGYLKDLSLQVLSYKKIKPDFDPLYKVSYMDRTACIGKYKNDCLAMVINPEGVKEADNQNLRMFPLDATGFLVSDCEIVDKTYTDKLLYTLLDSYKKGKLYFDSFEVYEWLKTKMACRYIF